jgi:hypothetical protein
MTRAAAVDRTEVEMAQNPNPEKQIKKDQRTPRDTREELLDEVRPTATQPHIENPNRDRARGDWDRTGDHHDEQT